MRTIAAATAGFLAAGRSAAGRTVTTSTSAAAPARPAKPAKAGGTLTGVSAGERTAVRLVRIVQDAHGSDQFSTPKSGPGPGTCQRKA